MDKVEVTVKELEHLVYLARGYAGSETKSAWETVAKWEKWLETE